MKENYIEVKDLKVNYGSFVLMENINFSINKGDIFVIMGASGSGKSTILRLLTGLKTPDAGRVYINGTDFYSSPKNVQDGIMQKCGILYQSGALFSFMTLLENVSMPLQQYTNYSPKEIKELASLKLALVGLAGFEEFYPSELSGGMKKRAGFARALALDPEILYFDEPSSGLDPISSSLLDDLIVRINESMGTTIVMVSHDLSSILSIGRNSIFIDNTGEGIIGRGNPKKLLENPPNKKVEEFLTRRGKNYVQNSKC